MTAPAIAPQSGFTFFRNLRAMLPAGARRDPHVLRCVKKFKRTRAAVDWAALLAACEAYRSGK